MKDMNNYSNILYSNFKKLLWAGKEKNKRN
jgi:hypothetical protein